MGNNHSVSGDHISAANLNQRYQRINGYRIPNGISADTVTRIEDQFIDFARAKHPEQNRLYYNRTGTFRTINRIPFL